jgi:hypothetical protein
MNGDQIQALLKQTNLDIPGPFSSVSLQLLSTAMGFLFFCIGGSVLYTFVLAFRLQNHIRINTNIYELAYADRRTSSHQPDGADLPFLSHFHVSQSDDHTLGNH